MSLHLFHPEFPSILLHSIRLLDRRNLILPSLPFTIRVKFDEINIISHQLSIISPYINENSRHEFTRRSTLQLINEEWRRTMERTMSFFMINGEYSTTYPIRRGLLMGRIVEFTSLILPPGWASHSSSFLLSSIILPMGFNFVVWSDVVKDLFTWKTTKWERGERERRRRGREGGGKGDGDDVRKGKNGVRWRTVQKNGRYLRLVMKENGENVVSVHFIAAWSGIAQNYFMNNKHQNQDAIEERVFLFSRGIIYIVNTSCKGESFPILSFALSSFW